VYEVDVPGVEVNKGGTGRVILPVTGSDQLASMILGSLILTYSHVGLFHTVVDFYVAHLRLPTQRVI